MKLMTIPGIVALASCSLMATGCYSRSSADVIEVGDSFSIDISYTPTVLAERADKRLAITQEISDWSGSIRIESRDGDRYHGTMHIAAKLVSATACERILISMVDGVITIEGITLVEFTTPPGKEYEFHLDDFILAYEQGADQWRCTDYTNKSGVVVHAAIRSAKRL
jgi:hypothetical protein